MDARRKAQGVRKLVQGDAEQVELLGARRAGAIVPVDVAGEVENAFAVRRGERRRVGGRPLEDQSVGKAVRQNERRPRLAEEVHLGWEYLRIRRFEIDVDRAAGIELRRDV